MEFGPNFNLVLYFVLLLYGLYSVLYVGIMGRGLEKRRTKRLVNSLGSGTARLIYAAVGVGLIVWSVIYIMKYI